MRPLCSDELLKSRLSRAPPDRSLAARLLNSSFLFCVDALHLSRENCRDWFFFPLRPPLLLFVSLSFHICRRRRGRKSPSLTSSESDCCTRRRIRLFEFAGRRDFFPPLVESSFFGDSRESRGRECRTGRGRGRTTGSFFFEDAFKEEEGGERRRRKGGGGEGGGKNFCVSSPAGIVVVFLSFFLFPPLPFSLIIRAGGREGGGES